MDNQHTHVVSIADEIDKEILKTRILIDELNYLKSKALSIQLNTNLETIKTDLDKLRHIFIEEFEKADNNDLKEFEKEYKVNINNFRTLNMAIENNQTISDSLKTEILLLYNKLSISNHKFRYFLQRYLYDNTITYKKQVTALFIVILLFIFFSGYIVVYLINQLSIAERIQIQRTIEIESNERQRIAADLHDGMGAYLSSIIMSIELLGKEYENNEDLTSKIKHINQLSRLAIQSVEEVINNLNPSLLARLGLFKALEKTLSRINSLGKTQFSIDSFNLHLELSQSMEIMLYRICMELINNALKHSNAKNAKFSFFNVKNKINISYEDNGIGFVNDEKSYENNKTGLYNLSKRVESVGGSYLIESEIDRGVIISIVFKI